MLPPIPQKLWKIDDSTVGDHYFLDGADRCFYVWEYAAHKGYGFSPANNFVWNLKIKPGVMVKSRRRFEYKLEAIMHAGRALRAFISREFVEAHATFVPMPCSKVTGDPEYDDRLLDVLDFAFHGWNADVRDMLRFAHSMSADHEREVRIGFDTLLDMTTTTAVSDRPPRPVVVIVDDVLTTGKHFKVVQRRVLERWQGVEIRGLFLARCVRDTIKP